MQGHGCAEGHRDLDQNQHHLGVAELVEQGHAFQEERSQPGRVSPRQDHRQRGHRQDGPSEPRASDQQPREAQRKRQSAEVKRAPTEALLSPVQLVVATLHIRNGHTPPLSSRHAVFQDVVAVQPFARLLCRHPCGHVGLATCRELGVLLCQGQLSGLRKHGQDARQGQQSSGLGHAQPFAFQCSPDPSGHRHGAEQKQEVVGHLDVVRLKVQGRKQGRHSGTAPHSTSVREDHTSQDAWHGGDGTHLGGMTRRQVQNVQTGQTKSKTQDQGEPRRQAQTQPQRVRRHHRNEHRPHLNGHKASNRLPRPLWCGADVCSGDLDGGHSTKHAVCPMRNLAVTALHIARLLGHANVVLDVALLQQLVLQHHWRQQHGRCKKHHHNGHGVGKGCRQP